MPKLKIPKTRTVEVPARIWKRAVSFLVDLLIINAIILYPFKKYFRSIIPTTNYQEAVNYVMANPAIIDTMTKIGVMVSIILVLYFSLSVYKTGTSIGKYLFKIRTKSLDKEMKYWQCLVSSLTFILFMPFVILWVVDPLHMLLSEKKQRFMERISKLETVEEVIVT
ncbi:RDD family protein [Candidatus Woesearchaeota archaeon]|nr:RDD family protein [Candidatus Woesearchaeota archaeon]